MKKITSTLKGLMIMLMVISANVSFSQTAPAFDVYITNECYPAAKTFQFDVWIRKSNVPDVLQIGNLQMGIDVNPSWRGAANSITATIVSGSSMMPIIVGTPSFQYNNNGGNSSNDRLNIQ